MGAIKTHCDAGCQKAFEIEDFQMVRIGDGVDKVYFTCPHCGHEYISFYTDPEIRELQSRIRRVQQLFANPRADHVKAEQREAEIKAQIKEKMDSLRVRMQASEGKEVLYRDKV